ncbi:MAG: GNAT family N-acetyltransferase [Candidatus Eisenbacteria bacterium]|nr:GNAT family N-acetyltransferase [Candidatus Eisenbacteria bacterium]
MERETERDVTLTTDRLVLREFREDDWSAVHEYASDPEVVRYMPWGPNSEEDTRAFIERALALRSGDPRKGYEFAVTLRDGGRLIGGCGIHAMSLANRSAFIGYCFHPDAWGHGYATEAARALVEFAIGTLGLHRVAATCDIENAASARVLEKAGMRREGHFREDALVRGRWRDSYQYALLDHEWKGATP